MSAVTNSFGRALAVLDTRRWKRSIRFSVLVVAVVLILGLAGVATVGYLKIESRDGKIDAGTAATATAKKTVPQVLSYSPTSVQADLDKATSLLTGDFRDKFSSLSAQVIVPAAQNQGIKTAATVVETSTVSAAKDKVTLLMFVNQTTSTAADDTPKLAGSRIKVVMSKTGGSWLVSELTPL